MRDYTKQEDSESKSEDRLQLLLLLLEFIGEHKNKADIEYSKYNGFNSQIYDTKRNEKLTYMEMWILSRLTTIIAKFWNDEYEKIVYELTQEDRRRRGEEELK